MSLNRWTCIQQYLFLVLIVASTSAAADPEYKKDTSIFFGNGILTTEEAAISNLRSLRGLLISEINDPELESQLTFDIAYNHSGLDDGQGTIRSAIEDLLEAGIQIEGLDLVQHWRAVSGIAQETSETFTDALVQIVSEGLADIAENIVLAQNPAVQEHIDKYNQLLGECKRVVVVAHSQGNLYANVANLGIEPTLADGFGIVSVANPDNMVGNGTEPYTTLYKDLVIAAVELLYNSANPNVRNYGVLEIPDPFHGHDFVENYLDTSRPAKEKIINDLVGMIEQVQDFDNIDYCGWLAFYASTNTLFREPYDKVFDEQDNVSSETWDLVWDAVSTNTLRLEFRTTLSGWQQVFQRDYRERFAYYHTGSEDELDQQTPYFWFFNDAFSSRKRYSIEIQPHDINNGIPYGYQEYRIIVDNKVIDQFAIDYDQVNWNPAKTSLPIAEELYPGSIPIIPTP